MHHATLRDDITKLPKRAAVAFILCAFTVLFAIANPALALAQNNNADAIEAANESTLLAGVLNDSEVSPQTTDDIAAGEIGTCYWKIDANGKLTLAPKEGDTGIVDFYNPVSSDPGVSSSDDGRPPWYPYRNSITSAEVIGTVTVTGTTCRLFENCEKLVDVDLSGLDTSQVMNFGNMFYGCKSLVSVDMSMLDTSSFGKSNFYGDSFYIFARCTSLKDVKLPDFSNANVTCLSGWFDQCVSLETVDLSSIDTSHVRNSNQMFNRCQSLRKVIVGEKWDLPKRNDGSVFFDQMFVRCNALVGANGTSYAAVKADPNTETVADNATYARIDTAETPGYFWPVESGEGSGETGNGNGEEQGGNESGDNGSGNNASGSGNGGQNSGEGGSANQGTDGHSGGGTESGTGNGADGDDLGAATNPSVGTGGSADNSNSSASNTSKTASNKTTGGASSSITSKPKEKVGTISSTLIKVANMSAAQTATTATKAKSANSGSFAKAVAKQTKPKSIAKATVKLSATSFAYDGNAKKPNVVVKLGKKILRSNRDYTVAYSKGRKKVGAYKVVVTGKGSYKSRVAKRFTIVPKAPRLTSLVAQKNSDGSSGFIATWKKPGMTITGYQVRWSPNKSFNSTCSYSFKSTTPYAKQSMVALCVRTPGWLGKRSYVQMRTYQIVSGKTYYSSWSTAKAVDLKK